MEIKPVKTSALPQYPVREAVSPEQLKESVPQRWADSRAAKIALGTLAAMSITGLASCGAPQGMLVENSFASEGTVIESCVTEYLPEGTTAPAMLSVAPLFEHGEGMGAFGCDMVTPPAFLSEDEALAVINTVAKEYGLKFTAGNAPMLQNVLQPATNIYEPEKKEASEKYVVMTPDFSDKEHGVALEFVSSEDVKTWHQDQGFMSTVENYDMLDAAEQLSESLEAAYGMNYDYAAVGVLYDPCDWVAVKNGEDAQAAEAQSRDQSEAQLARQVKDFLEWLKAEGVI